MSPDDWFGEFWKVYPLKRGIDDARRNFKKALSRAAPQEIIEGARRYAQEVAGKDKQFIKYPQGWLSGGRWADETVPTYVSTRQPSNVLEFGFYAGEGTPELVAWDKHYRMTKGVPAPRDSGFGFRFPTRWPPDAKYG